MAEQQLSLGRSQVLVQVRVSLQMHHSQPLIDEAGFRDPMHILPVFERNRSNVSHLLACAI